MSRKVLVLLRDVIAIGAIFVFLVATAGYALRGVVIARQASCVPEGDTPVVRRDR